MLQTSFRNTGKRVRSALIAGLTNRQRQREKSEDGDTLHGWFSQKMREG
jgi:hypothetical protein